MSPAFFYFYLLTFYLLVLRLWCSRDILSINNNNHRLDYSYICTAPLWQQVFDWFREKHNIFIQITHSSNINNEVGYKYHLRSANKWYDDKVNFNSKIGLIFTYREAQIRGINKAIELIKP